MTHTLSNSAVLFIFAAVNLLIVITAAILKMRLRKDKKEADKIRPIQKPLSFSVKNDIFEINKIILIVEELERYNIPYKVIFDLNLALEEAFTNIISYAYDDDEEHIIFIRISQRGNDLIIEVEDDGREFNPLTTPEFDLSVTLEDINMKALSLHLIRKMVDSLDYLRTDKRNILIMKKDLNLK